MAPSAPLCENLARLAERAVVAVVESDSDHAPVRSAAAATQSSSRRAPRARLLDEHVLSGRGRRRGDRAPACRA